MNISESRLKNKPKYSKIDRFCLEEDIDFTDG